MAAARWMVFGALAAALNTPRVTHGVCVYEGSVHVDKSTWQPQSCQECTCYDNVVICAPIRCANPQCDFQRGERLRIPANQCCPECISSVNDSCNYQSVTYAHDSQWSPSPCKLCECSRGVVSCAPHRCPTLSCPDNHTPFTPAGECCPKCSRTGESCSWQGTAYRDGEDWHPSQCSRCVCHSGDVRCSVAECPQVACKPNENLVIQPGHCCPQCVSNPCLSAGKEYQHGEQWQKDTCTTCVCERGQSRCHTHICSPVTCDKGETKVRRTGQCCHECAAARGSCLYQGLVRYHGDMWNASACEFCMCNRGQVLCHRAECGRLHCPQGSELVHPSGMCCPQCSLHKMPCLYQGQPYKNLARWTNDNCRECKCHDSLVTCYLPSCPACRPGTLVVAHEGQCCPQCHQVPCDADCQSCSGTPDHCDSCKDSKAVLYLGRCLSVCPDGFFPDGVECAACPSSCAICSSRWSCQSCVPQLPLLSAEGDRCMATCPAGTYQDNLRRQCRRCSESCSECVGPSPRECTSCSDPAALLQDSECVPDCGTAFYSQDGVCHACHSSCDSCFPDKPDCATCPPGSALHRGKCVSTCPAQHYSDHSSRCRGCHSSCASCWGPSASHCTSCAQDLLLHQGQCVEVCGDGLYPDAHTCHNCHPSCRSCVGPLASDCLRCVKATEVLAPQWRDFLPPRGVCMADCPAHTYADYQHICTECHPSCLRCTESSADSCTSCPMASSLHEGRCVHTCPQGFFVQDGHCQACHPSCQTCSGASQADCTSCPPLADLNAGHCRTGCQDGRFLYTSTAQCLECSPDCQRCTADVQTGVGSICLLCRGPGAGALLLGDHCVPRCPRDHYGWRGACMRCHPSCEACSGEGPLACTSCHAPRVLLPSGVCAPRCPLGYYDNGHRVCEECTHQCLTCDGAGTCTSCRDPTKVLLFGECQYESCAQQYYLNATTHTCTECDWSCNSCRGPLHTDCLQCMDGYVLRDGVCAQGCPVGSYRDGDRCLDCDDTCVECRGPGQCLRCQPPYATLRGQCVLQCGRNYFLDADAQSCQPCSTDCVLCDGVGRCRACGLQSYLMEGYCTPDCGHGYYPRQKSRTCHANGSPPTLHINGSLQVPLGGSVPLTPTLVQVNDPDSTLDDLVVQLVRRPTNGRLVVFDGGLEDKDKAGGQELSDQDTFSLAQLGSAQVHFQHRKDKARTGEFTLQVADPQLSSQAQTIQVQALSMQPPRVLVLSPLSVKAPGEAQTITKSTLLVDDPDNPADVLVMVLEPPHHGLLTRLHGDRSLNRFKLEELSRERVQYIHDGSREPQDHMVLQINDGHSYQNVLLQVHINHKADDSLELQFVPTTWVKGGGMVRISSRHLQAHYKGVSADNVVYTILNSDGQPKYGEVVLVPMPADGPPEGWNPTTDERGFTATTSFTQQDVDDGTVWYHHFGSGTPADSFRFQVSAQAAAVTQSEAQTFTIGVLPQIPGFPQLDPDCDLQVTALEDRVTQITRSALSFMDSETPSDRLVYNITKPLPAEQGTIEHRDRPYMAVKHFTQADVDKGKIVYRPPQAPSHLQELYQYSFIVSDGENTTPELDFAILLLSNHQQPPMFQVLDPFVEVSMGGEATVGGQQLAVSDADTSPDELEFELVEAPVHGELLKIQSGARVRMTNGDSFTFSDITHNGILYRHASLSHRDDTFTISVSDGISMATVAVQVAVLGSRAGGDGPQRDPAAALSLEVGKRSSTVISRSHLAYTDDSSPDEQIHIQLVSVPMYGILTRTQDQREPQQLREYSTFSMDDINRGGIRYITSLEMGNQPVTDIFHFVVYDGDNNRLDNQMCTITITANARQPPAVTVRSGIKVQEGGRVQLSTNHIIISDLDTPGKNLLVWLVSPPKYGFIENTKQAGGSVGGSEAVTPEIPFSVEDLMSDHIFYVQRRGQPAQQDTFSFYVSDGNSQTEAFNVNIDIQGKQQSEPLVSVSSIHVEENSGVVVTNASLSVLDQDTPQNEILFTVIRKPSYGKLRRRQFYSQPLESGRILSQGSTFTYQDVLDRLLVYTPEMVSGGVDELVFSVTDGIHTQSTGRLRFTMDITRSEGPRMTVNRGLQLPAGSSSKITEQNLKATDMDSDSLKLRYIMTKDPPSGKVQLSSARGFEKVSVKGPVRSFTQEDVNKGLVRYNHEKGEKGGSQSFKFNLVDPEGNKLIDQSFFVSVLEDRLPPSVVVNKGLVLDENSVKKLTTLQLSASDQDSEPGELLYRITKQSSLGHLEHTANPGVRVDSFSQADLASRSVQYVHTSQEEKHADQFSFTVSDGTNEVAQTFYITIKPVDDSLPLVHIPGMRVQEGVRKTITEFELKATDADTEAESIVFTVVQPPRHGAIERTGNGQHYRPTATFTMEDIYQNRVSYNHDGSNSLQDRFTFTLADGTNLLFMVEDGGKEIVTAAPQKFKIEILPVDDGTPRIVTNLGLQWLEYMDGKATNLITKKELLTVDPDTDDEQLVYEVTSEPKHGFLESKMASGGRVSSFTQADINLGLIHYVLREESTQETMDNFHFLVKDGKPNVVSDNVFHIQWSLISFDHKSYNVSEKAGTVAVTVKRTGNLNQYAIVLCRTEQGSATSSGGVGSRPGQQDYVEYAGQVQFDEREDVKVCTVVLNDDFVFEGIESFHVELSMPVYALLGTNTRALVNVNDTEDEPTLEFDRKTFHVNESAGVVRVPVERKGDTSSMVSALCHTVSKSARGSSFHALESGSDYKSRGAEPVNRVVLGAGITMSTCDVTLIDDSEYELSEELELVLSEPSDNARIGRIAVAEVVIDGPNDASSVTLGNDTFIFGEDAGTIEIPVLRHGSDLSSVTSVWCATRPADPPSASPGVDYIPSSKKVEFKPGRTEESCSLTIMDDVQNPSIEGPESFVVFLSSPQGAVLQEPYEANVVITDTFQDIPSMQFEKTGYTVKESDGTLQLPVVRTGDLSFTSSARCFTRTMSAAVMDDFRERPNVDESRVTFLRGEKVKNCTVHVNDDSVFEPEEEFQVHLGTPTGDHWSGAMIGERDVVTITITNDEDAPTIELEQASYQVREPPGPDGVEVLNVKVIRRGDLDRTSKIRCSTRDGSAQSGVDYNPKSRVLKFTPGMDHVLFKVEIVSNEDREWHESFSLVLGPDDPVEAVLGEITMATVTILDQEAAGSLILPAPPIVVSLADYDHVHEVTKEGSKKTPSPGYPLVCVTPCDPHYPKYPVMKERCEEAGINQTQVHFSWEVASPTDTNGARSPFETVTDTTPFTGVNHMVLDSIYFSRRFHVRCVAQARDKAGHLGTPLRSNIATVGTEGSICHTPVTTGTARGFQAQSFIATLKYLDVKHKEHPNRIHISVQIPHQDGMLPLVSTMPLHNLHFLLSESIYRQQHVCSNLVTLKDLKGLSETGFLDDVSYDSISLGPGFDRPYQFNPNVREARTIQLYKHLNLKSCIWTFDAYYDMTELIDVCSGSVTADFQVRDSAQSFLTVQVPLYVSYIYVTAPRGWASLEHHTEMEFSFFYDTVLWRTGIQTDSVLSARLQIIRIYIREDGRLVIEFKTHAKFRGQFVPEHHTLPGHKSHLLAPDHLGGIEFDIQLLWSAQTFDSPYQLWRATSSYSRKDYSGEYTVFLIPCTVQPTQPWIDPGDKPLSCTAHAPEKFLVPIAFQQTNRPVPVVYSLNTEFQLCNNEKVFMMDPASTDVSMAEMDYKGAFSMGQILYGRVLWNPDQNLNAAYKLQLEKVYLCTGRDGYVPFFDPTGTLYNEGPQYGCIQPNKHLKHRFLLLDRKQPDVCDKYFHDVPFEASFASDLLELNSVAAMPGVDGFTMKVDALYKVEAGHQWYLQVIYVISPESRSSLRIERSLTYRLRRPKRDLVDHSGRLVLDESLIYDNEGDQVKNGTNMKALRLESGPSGTFHAQVGRSVGGGVATVALLLLVGLATCVLFRRCHRQAKAPGKKSSEEYPLDTKVEVCLDKCMEKNFSSKHCTVTNVNVFTRNQEAAGNKAKVKQVNLQVRLHNNLNDGTEV
ncbi:extracellular matrix protein FRAS1 isoform X3 [Syngnathoides biaculeatus]|uniref:extracellular matrix protein FRAS1 isoform X3 n=1 Tax=Syngnathoides biaculeatus TaxID=300417 RepID=UPI002ADE8C2B|nr:extracellular matrix protein FRAS1 isoform X3 [Syngnathoides biaculeatus]